MRLLLLISNRPSWREGLGVALSLVEDVNVEQSDRSAVCVPAHFMPTAVVIDADEESTMSHNSYDQTARALRELRTQFPEVPIVLVTEMPRDDICDLAISVRVARSLLPERLTNPRLLGEQVLDAIDTCPRAARPGNATSATVEITIRQTSVNCDVRVDGAIRFIGPRAFTSRDQLDILNNEFRHYEAMEKDFRNKVDRYYVSIAGQRARAALRGPLEVVQQFHPQRLDRPELLQYRFAFADGEFEFVPFEAISTANENEYLRDVHPFARRLLPQEQHRDADHDRVGDRPRLRVLFIASRAAGVMSAPPCEFKRQVSISLRALPHVDDELAGIESVYGPEVKVLDLDKVGNKIAAVEQAFESNEFDIVHFAGHSARADGEAGSPGTGEVFLALPGEAATPRSVQAYPAERLASLASNGHTRLVILSSCEGCSGTTLSRMASWGVPAVAGFRWPVDDTDASLFTLELHRQLQMSGGGTAVSLAFHRALVAVKARTTDELSPFSPVLMLQRSTWHDFHLGA